MGGRAVSPSQLEYYLDEYGFRFNCRTSVFRGELFFRLIQQAVQVEPFTRYELKKGLGMRLT